MEVRQIGTVAEKGISVQWRYLGAMILIGFTALYIAVDEGLRRLLGCHVKKDLISGRQLYI